MTHAAAEETYSRYPKVIRFLNIAIFNVYTMDYPFFFPNYFFVVIILSQRLRAQYYDGTRTIQSPCPFIASCQCQWWQIRNVCVLDTHNYCVDDDIIVHALKSSGEFSCFFAISHFFFRYSSLYVVTQQTKNIYYFLNIHHIVQSSV